MFGRKARRIAELEAELADALANLVNVTVQFPRPAQVAFEAAGVRKGVWHTASVQFKVDDQGSTLHGMYLGENPVSPVTPEHFDGSTPVVAPTNRIPASEMVDRVRDAWKGHA